MCRGCARLKRHRARLPAAAAKIAPARTNTSICNWFQWFQTDKSHRMAVPTGMQTHNANEVLANKARMWSDVCLYEVRRCHIKNSSDLNLHAKLNWVFDSIELCFFSLSHFAFLASTHESREHSTDRVTLSERRIWRNGWWHDTSVFSPRQFRCPIIVPFYLK